MNFESIPTLWLKLAAGLAAGSFLVWFFFRRAVGGGRAGAGLEALGPEYRLFSDVLVPTPYGMSRIDHVIASPYGIFVVSVKTLEGRVEGRETEEEWQVKYRGAWQTLYNPQWENRKLMNHLEAHLGDYPYIPIVLFTRARLKGRFAASVVNAQRLFAAISEKDRKVIDPEALEAVAGELAKRSGGAAGPA